MPDSKIDATADEVEDQEAPVEDTEDDTDEEVESEEHESGDGVITPEQRAKDLEHVKKQRAENAKLRAENKRLAERAKLADQYEAERMTEEEKQAAERARVAEEIADLQRERNTLQLQVDFPLLDDELLELLPDTTDYQVLSAKAQILSAKLEAQKPKGKPKPKVDPDEMSGGDEEEGDGGWNPRSIAKQIGTW